MKNSDRPLVSVITPSYNQADYIEETILSVLNQSYTNIEYIIIDGASSDTTIDIIRKYSDRISYWCSEPDKGQADAINKGLRRATGDYVCWINSDDVLYPNFVETFVNCFEQNPNVDFIYGNVEQGPDIQHKFLRKGKQTDFVEMLTTLSVPIPQQATMWRRSLMEKIGFLEVEWHVLLDREYFMRVAQHVDILYVPKTVAFFRNHDASKSVAEWHKWIPELQRYYNRIFSDKTKKYYAYKKLAMANMDWECFKIACTCGLYKQALSSFWSMFRLTPFKAIKRVGIYILFHLKHIIMR